MEGGENHLTNVTNAYRQTLESDDKEKVDSARKELQEAVLDMIDLAAERRKQESATVYMIIPSNEKTLPYGSAVNVFKKNGGIDGGFKTAITMSRGVKDTMLGAVVMIEGEQTATGNKITSSITLGTELSEKQIDFGVAWLGIALAKKNDAP